MSLDLESYLGLITGAATSEIPPASEANRLRQFVVLLYRVLLREILQDGILRCDPERAGYYYTNRIVKPASSLPIIGVVGGYPILMGVDLEADGTVATASTTQITDAGLSGTDGHWVRAYVVFTSGVNIGLACRVTDYDATQHKLTWAEALGTAPSPGDTYTVSFFYVSDLTADATNYVFARKGSDTVSRGIAEFHASVSATVPDAEILLASAVLDANGDCISYDDHPTGAARDLFAGVGQYKTISGSGSLELAGSASQEITISHDQLLFCGGLTFELTGTNAASGSYAITEHHKDDELVITITNDTGGTLTFGYAWTRSGRVLAYG